MGKSEMNKKILFIYTNYSTFVKTDFEILSTENEVTKYQFKPVKGPTKTAIQVIKQLIFLLFNIWKFNTVFIWFADYHSFLPVFCAKIFRKRSFVVIGGYDVVKMPNLNYGVFTSKFRGYCAVYSMKNSTLNLAVSKNVERKVRWIAPESNVKLVYNCVNISDDKEINPEKEDLVLTVAFIDSERTFYLKGIDTFIEVAKLLPEIKFMIIGLDKNMSGQILKNLPKNLELVGRVNHSELQNYYKKAKIYCQFSRSESFGVSIVEAMYFGCVPVVTNAGGMPELVDNLGFVVKKEPEKIADLIKRIVLNKVKIAENQEKYFEKFEKSKRKNKLLKYL